jgi:probable F420-dependent oxidoreductase
MATYRPFRFGVVAAQARSADEWTALARRVEELGYATLVVPDFIGPGLTPLPALGVAAAATRTLRLGTYVLANDFHNPHYLARECATLDLLSNGRLELGLGAGRPHADADYAALGLSYDAPGTRVSRLAEALRVIKPLLAGQRLDADGPSYQLAGAELHVKPVQQPRPPILIAGAGQRLLSLAAREADIVAIGAGPQQGLEALTERVGWLREAAGARFDELELNINLFGVVPNPDDPAIAQQPTRFGVNLAQLIRDGAPLVLTGSPDAMCAQLQRLRETLGVSYICVPQHQFEQLAPVVGQLAGQ